MSINLFGRNIAFTLPALAAVMLTLTGCGDDPTDTPDTVTLTGETRAMAGGEVRSWLEVDGDGKPLAVGITFSEAAMEGLEADDAGFAEELALPDEASKTAYRSLGVRWKPQGSLLPPYTAPFFDVDFFEITDAERAAMTPADSMTSFKQPEAGYAPPNYVLRNGVVPGYGTRYSPGWGTPASDTTNDEFHGGVFDHGLIYYFYDGMISLSVVKVTLDMLKGQEDVTAGIKQPQKYRRNGVYYATEYHVEYDPAAAEYTLLLDGMELR